MASKTIGSSSLGDSGWSSCRSLPTCVVCSSACSSFSFSLVCISAIPQICQMENQVLNFWLFSSNGAILEEGFSCFCGQLYCSAEAGFHHVFGLFVDVKLFLHHVSGPLVSVGLVLHHVCGPLVSVGLTLYHIFGLLASVGSGFSVVDLSAYMSVGVRLSFSASDLSAVITSTRQFFFWADCFPSTLSTF